MMDTSKALFPRFLIVGGIGFMIDASILQFLFVMGAGPYLARLASVLVAMSATWYLSRAFVFRTKSRRGPEYLRHLLAQSVGMLVNLGVYTGLLLVRPELREIPLAALVIASVAALLVNFMSARHWTYRDEA